ncbi:DNA polymerase III subunit delta [Puniceicoccales bacterium CK1056]|uniref:DNA polymerase III subunit delta n=1 Tax=Oceanipulchritudo coccoides TaxID=2706888 RepID=A0A6B2M2M4_9BACT|nr:DNA polymerase III subunit delta [Oceanipulchritudo coccoides]NDV62055.1 DNA polymerase III subunit delta [Oceanipulchritudo coccoides]
MPFRFIAGPDDFLVQRKAREEWESMAKEFSDPNSLEEVDGQAGTIDEAEKAINQFISSVQTVSMFTPEKAVWFKNITFLADSVTGRSKTTVEAVERMQDLLDNFDDPAVKILVSASPVDRRKKAYKWFQKNGDSLFLDASKDETALLAMLKEEASAAGKQFKGNAAQILVELIGGSTRLGLEETGKLITYLGDKDNDITPELVSELVPSVGDSDFFEAAEAFYSLKLEWALEAIHRHFFAGHDARPLISSLQNRNRLLIQLKAMQAAGGGRGRIGKADLERAASRYGEFFGASERKSSFNIFTQNPWYLGKLSEVLPSLSLKTLIEFQEAFRDAFMEIIFRPNEQEAVLSGMAVRCLAPLQAK